MKIRSVVVIRATVIIARIPIRATLPSADFGPYHVRTHRAVEFRSFSAHHYAEYGRHVPKLSLLRQSHGRRSCI